MTQSHLTSIAATLWPRLRLGRLRGWLYLCWQRSRQRRALASLGEHQLRDLGLAPEDVRQEIRRPPWR
jgi:uncharacterized protein YjiS (DUF1127 family)